MRACLAAASLLLAAVATAAPAPANDTARLATQAAGIQIVRDHWGIAHVYGKTDADAVFGMIYAQAEDDFSRIERNYLVNLGWLAQAEGESALYSDLRARLFVDEHALRAAYAGAPAWLKALMGAWADGLNYYLARHADAKPLVIHRFEPWMALSFTEGSIGGDIENVDLGSLEAFYGKARVTARVPQSRRRLLRAVRTASRSRRRAAPVVTRCCGSTRTPRTTSAPSCRW